MRIKSSYINGTRTSRSRPILPFVLPSLITNDTLTAGCSRGVRCSFETGGGDFFVFTAAVSVEVSSKKKAYRQSLLINRRDIVIAPPPSISLASFCVSHTSMSGEYNRKAEQPDKEER